MFEDNFFLIMLTVFKHRDWSPKFATGLNRIIGCSSRSIWVIKLSFCQNDPLMGELFRQNNSLVTHILFELQSIIMFSPVANFGDQSPEVLKLKWDWCKSIFHRSVHAEHKQHDIEQCHIVSLINSMLWDNLQLTN